MTIQQPAGIAWTILRPPKIHAVRRSEPQRTLCGQTTGPTILRSQDIVDEQVLCRSCCTALHAWGFLRASAKPWDAPWTPLVPCEPDPSNPEYTIYKNSQYQVHKRIFHAKNTEEADLVHLSFKCLDRGTAIPYRDKMRIKDELVGPECEGVELLPARSREVDTANQYHLWVIDDPTYRFPFGFVTRLVSDTSILGAVQEPWPEGERPVDCCSPEMLTHLLEERQSEGDRS